MKVCSLSSHIVVAVRLQRVGEQVTEDQLHEILSEVDANKNAQVDMGEFLQVRPARCACVLCEFYVLFSHRLFCLDLFRPASVPCRVWILVVCDSTFPCFVRGCSLCVRAQDTCVVDVDVCASSCVLCT